MIRRVTAFTLIELLMVIALIAIILAFVVPATNNILHGNDLTRAGQMVSDRLSLVRQMAIARNHKIEVRFYYYADPMSGSTTNALRAIQSFEMDTATSFVALEKVQQLPSGIIIDSGTTLSSIVPSPTSFSLGTSAGMPSIPRANYNYSYFAVHFLPNGSTDLLPTSDWFLTLHELNKGDNLKKPPPNYITIDIDPVGGSLKTFRPGT